MNISPVTQTSYEKLPEQLREVMSNLAKFASDQGTDYVPQAWKRDLKHKRAVPDNLMNALIKLGYIKTTFKNGPAYEILKWPKETVVE